MYLRTRASPEWLMDERRDELNALLSVHIFLHLKFANPPVWGSIRSCCYWRHSQTDQSYFLITSRVDCVSGQLILNGQSLYTFHASNCAAYKDTFEWFQKVKNKTKQHVRDLNKIVFICIHEDEQSHGCTSAHFYLRHLSLYWRRGRRSFRFWIVPFKEKHNRKQH